ncbi:molybdopterin biosynthesis protein [Polycladomyces subterraneus]|uniref:Molybdopterin molybdenumtransferase n=1 Tax=Polycladomyces subterraneus TaxID=1016997 RepID=A0ABT8IR64_9BACL|nr:molybdopterin biosynthesis protein [Polycladomyces subterraneus]MDN4594584.1 molybdopterin biosynthesis protein [Polycladomyces subterraneus]
MRQTEWKLAPLDEARERFLREVRFSPSVESVPVLQAHDRVTAKPVVARRSVPEWPLAAMDGVAVRAEMTVQAAPDNPVRLSLGREAVWIDTGDPLPDFADTIIPVEQIGVVDEKQVEVFNPVPSWKHIRTVGEDVCAGETILPPCHRIRPIDLGVMLAAGVEKVSVWQPPRVAVIPTGNELVMPGQAPERGQIVESNGTVISGYLREWGAIPDYRGIVPDEPDHLIQAVQSSVKKCDMVVLNAGSSAGSEDYTVSVIRKLGRVVQHGVATRPGKPVILGIVEGKPVVGLPGYPVSSYLGLQWFVRPLIEKWFGIPIGGANEIRVRLGADVVVKTGAEDFVRVALGEVRGEMVAYPLAKGAGVASSLSRADGWLRVPTDHHGWKAGERVTVELIRPRGSWENRLLVAGEPDVGLDVLAGQIASQIPGSTLLPLPMGQEEGWRLLREGRCHLVLLAGDISVTGEAETKDASCVRIHGWSRVRGWMMRSDPGHQSIAEWLRRGAQLLIHPCGTRSRQWLEAQLADWGIIPEDMRGCNRVAANDRQIAAAIAAGSADIGIGCPAVAREFGLLFVPAWEEDVQFVVPKDWLRSSMGRLLMEALQSCSFRMCLEMLGGYRCGKSGEKIGSL